MGGGGGRGELSRHYEGGAISSPGFERSTFVPPTQEETTRAVDEVIEAYVSHLAPPPRQVRLLGELKVAVHSALSREFGIEGVNVVGSVAKDTQIDRAGGNDIDVLFVLDHARHGDWLGQENGPRNCLTKVRDLVASDPRFSQVEVRVDRNTVTARIGASSIDIIPSFRHPEGGVWIPDTSGGQRWIRTHPRMSKRILEVKDRVWQGQVTQVLKIVKKWNDRTKAGLTSTHLEALVEGHFDRKPRHGENSQRANVHEFFARLPWYIQERAYEQAYGQRVDTYLTSSARSKAISKASRMAKRIENAERIARRTNQQDAAAEAYREVLDG